MNGMTGSQLRDLLDYAEISQTDFARLIGMTNRRVNFWIKEDYRVPNPVVAYLRLYDLLPPELKQFELGRLKYRATR